MGGKVLDAMFDTVGRGQEAITRFGELMRGTGDVPLDEVALTVSAALQGGLDVVGWLAALDELAAACPTPTFEGIRRHLFETAGFTGNTARYDDWRNSCLDRVLDTRRGIPITLSVVMIEVGRRLGVEIHGVGMPGHFLVGDGDDVFVDAFHSGQVLDRAGCRALCASITGDRLVWRDDFLDVTSSRAIVARMLNNLVAGFARSGCSMPYSIALELRSRVPELAPHAEETRRALAQFN
jgi:regulator of sirC expression with transglutaminase-like and TPR domain